MKKSLAILSFLCLTISAFAQLKIGIKGGGNFSYVSSDTPTGAVGFDWEALTSYHIGGFVQLPLNDKLAFRAELLYSFEGAEAQMLFPQPEKINIDYLNLPLLLRFHLLSSLYIDLGVEPGIIVNNDNNILFDKNAELGLLAGVGLRVGERLGIFARYVHGVTDIYDGVVFTDGGGVSVGDGTAKARLWQIGAELYLFK